MDIPWYRQYDLPWSSEAEQEQRFRRLLGYVLGAALLLGILWPWLPSPELPPWEAEEIPPRLARLVLERQPPPPPPVPEEHKPDPVPETEVPPEPERRTEPEPVPEPPRVNREEAARERAQAALLPFAEDLAALRDADVVSRVADNRPLAGAAAAERTERSMITSRAGAASPGIDTAALSRNTGGAGLAARATTRVDQPAATAGPTPGEARSDIGGRPSRSREEIELVFDRNKGAIFALYNRALREDPTLAGKLVLRLTIAPSGEVTACEIVSSELGNEELERRLVQRIKMFRFEAKDVDTVTTTKPIDFFPA